METQQQVFTLQRFNVPKAKGTFGYLTLGADKLFTAEQRWNNNIPHKSCVPTGMYELVPYQSPRYGSTYALRNHALDVGVFEGEAKRFACILHAANWPSELEGCIAPGEGLGCLSLEFAVTSSTAALRKLKKYIEDNSILHLHIRGPE